MTVVSNGQFWMYTLALLIFWIIVLTTAFHDVSNIKNKLTLSQTNGEDEVKNTGICKNLCKQCGCLGFFCGEECICECNDDHTDTECIRKIQINAQSLNIPFEVLIQGPTANHFVRNALLYEQNQERKLFGYRNKRSTVTVYKPRKENLNLQQSSCEIKTAFKDIFKTADNLKNRHKRSSTNNHFEWFSNLGTNLLRPAPLGGRKRQVEETNKPTTKPTTISSIFDNSWIFDNTRNVLTPRPLNKRKITKPSAKTSAENLVDSSLEAENPHVNKQLRSDFTDKRKADNEESKNTTPNKKKSFSVEEKDREGSQENLIGKLYTRIFKNNFNKMDDHFSFLPKEKDQEESQDYLTGVQLFASDKDDLSHIEDDKIDLFSEEVEEEKKPEKKVQESKTDESSSSVSQNLLSTSQNFSPINLKKGLQHFRIPWFKPGRLLEKFRRVVNP